MHRGEHEPTLSRDLFEAVQEKLAANAVARQVRLRGSAALLTGRLFDDRGNRMSPTHANKKGARYRYYVSQALLQNRKAEAGNIARVPAPEIESLVCDSVRRHLGSRTEVRPPTALADRDLIERHVAHPEANLVEAMLRDDRMKARLRLVEEHVRHENYITSTVSLLHLAQMHVMMMSHGTTIALAVIRE